MLAMSLSGRSISRRKTLPIIFFFLVVPVCLSMAAGAQELAPKPEDPPSHGTADLPSSTRPLAPEPIAAQQPASPAIHPFWDPTNRMLFAGVALFRALDYASTRNMQARGREEILLPDEVVNNSPGFASLEAAGAATSVGLSYWMHRTRHHSMERWISIVHISVTGFGVVRNYCLVSKHPVNH
jgi:hypothetical protein